MRPASLAAPTEALATDTGQRGAVPGDRALESLAELVREETGFAGEIRWDASQPNGQPRRRLDTSRARELFGFEAEVPLREGIARTVAWYRAQA